MKPYRGEPEIRLFHLKGPASPPMPCLAIPGRAEPCPAAFYTTPAPAPQEASYYRGKLYSARKQQGARTDLTLAQNGLKLSTADELGKEYGVSKNTIKRDEQFSKAVDKVAVEVGDEACILRSAISDLRITDGILYLRYDITSCLNSLLCRTFGKANMVGYFCSSF